jgi:predicted phage terminase large subunit-like protein
VDISLHEHQLKIFEDYHRFKVVAAGRRFGKSYLAAVTLFVEAARQTKVRTDGVEVDLSLEEVYYIAPTFEQGKKILWPLLKELGQDLISQKYENTGTLTLINGRRISIKGADRPDSLRGVGLSYVVMDEYAFMKPEVWELIIRPALARSEGGALFIGTPDGKNHFYDLWIKALTGEAGNDWAAWSYTSTQNPFLPKAEFAAMTAEMSRERYRQEIEASFESQGGVVLTREMFPIWDSRGLPSGEDYIAIDLAGFTAVEGGRKRVRLDEHSIAVVRSHSGGWLIRDIIHGRWDVRETALRIVKAFRDYRPAALGVERGIAMTAVLPYLMDEMNRIGVFFDVRPLTHGNQKKADRIAWALQGRAEKGRIQLLEADWNKDFLDQCVDFPSPLAHDDLIDSVSYIDQIADPYFDGEAVQDHWKPLDEVAGY